MGRKSPWLGKEACAEEVTMRLTLQSAGRREEGGRSRLKQMHTQEVRENQQSYTKCFSAAQTKPWLARGASHGLGQKGPHGKG